ncbi:MAG: hypothetical protein IRY87_23515 [Acetobacteraceae bacterium]|nr:hypothetical protein [Acetobacteraceae bacterium]
MSHNGWTDKDPSFAAVSKFPSFEYSNKQLKRAGKIIASDLVWTDETAPVIREAFQIANSWRDAHAYPMRSLRFSVLHHMRKAELKGITAARLKRMQAIRRKLRRIKLGLNQLQDLGGCRVILPSISDVHRLVGLLRENIHHTIRAEDDYIANPKDDGYRSHHLIFSYQGKGKTEIYTGKRIELQVRTRLQHAWATAVEAVGLFRGEDLKSHSGSEEWLRLFKLLSAEFAETEVCPVPPDSMDKQERIREIRELERALDAISVLENIRHGVRGTDYPLMHGYRPTHYLIRYDHATKTVHVEPHTGATIAAQSYGNAEALGNQIDGQSQTVVLVEVDKIENLKAAYPNYFGDVDYFKNQLRAITQGQAAVEYAAVPRQPPPKPAGPYGDLSWLRARRFPGPSLSKK